MDFFSLIMSKKNCSQGNIEEYIEQGRQEEWSEFWDEFQDNGNRTDYQNAFYGRGWTMKNFKPKYDIICLKAAALFSDSKIEGSLKEILNKQGVILDVSNAVNLVNAFSGSSFTELPEFTLTRISGFSYTFTNMINLESLKIVANSGFSSTVNTFNNCVSLRNLELVGSISSPDLNVQWSPLTHDSLINILNNLVDKSADTSRSWTVTLGADNIAKLTPEELKIAENKGWVVV